MEPWREIVLLSATCHVGDLGYHEKALGPVHQAKAADRKLSLKACYFKNPFSLLFGKLSI